MDAGGDRSAILQAALAEFSALRGEIKDRSGAFWALVNLDITATAAVVGLALSDNVDPKILLVLPLLSPALGLLVIDHAYNINSLGTYIGQHLRPLVTRAAGSSELLAYEEIVDRYEEHRLLRFVPLGLPITLLFSGMPLAALLLVLPSLDAAWAWAIWGAGLLLVLTQTSLWLLFVFKPGLLDPLRSR